jgi:hypothetical protein
MVSISSPAKVSRSARVAAGTSTSTWTASQESGTRIGFASSQTLVQPADVVVGKGAHVGQARSGA